MRMYDIIETKRDGGELTDEQIQFFVTEYVDGRVTDYQAAALAMAIYLRGMNSRETASLTMAMMNSGDVVDLSPIPGIKVDKHSTGGVGDKTTIAIAPIVAAAGVPVAKMSGRALGHTGGTLDKLESIPGFSTQQPIERFFEIVNSVGCAVVGQTANLVPADKKLYALRDVTATVGCVPLIASSIMSKKLAAGADRILLDVKCGSGAFMKSADDAIELAEAMVAIGEELGRTTVALITDMDRPLGRMVGNSLEVIEAVKVLKGEAPEDLQTTCIELAATMLYLADKGDLDYCRSLAQLQIANGAALAKLEEMVAAQGGDANAIDDWSRLPQASLSRAVKSPIGGRVFSMDTAKIGLASVALGSGRETKEEPIDYGAGIILERKTGERVVKGEVLATLYSSDEAKLDEGERILLEAYEICDAMPQDVPHFLARVSSKGVERFC